MDKPSIDDLLAHVPGMYELAAVAGRRAVEIKKKNRDNTQPLQQALEEIGTGEVEYSYKNTISKDAHDGEQIELPLDLGHEREKVNRPAVIGNHDEDLPFEEDAADDEESVEEPEEIVEEVEVLEDDDDYSSKFYEEELDVSDDSDS